MILTDARRLGRVEDGIGIGLTGYGGSRSTGYRRAIGLVSSASSQLIPREGALGG